MYALRTSPSSCTALKALVISSAFDKKLPSLKFFIALPFPAPIPITPLTVFELANPPGTPPKFFNASCEVGLPNKFVLPLFTLPPTPLTSFKPALPDISMFLMSLKLSIFYGGFNISSLETGSNVVASRLTLLYIGLPEADLPTNSILKPI